MPELRLFFFRTSLDWLSALRSFSLFYVVDLQDLCNFCNRLFTPVYFQFLHTWVTFFLFFYISISLLPIKKKGVTENQLLDNYLPTYLCLEILERK